MFVCVCLSVEVLGMASAIGHSVYMKLRLERVTGDFTFNNLSSLKGAILSPLSVDES